MAGVVVVNNRTADASAQVLKLTRAKMEEFLDLIITRVQEPASPQPSRDGDRKIIHNESPVVPWQYDSGGVGIMDGNLGRGVYWKKQGDGYVTGTSSGYGAYHEFGTAHTNPNPAWARAIESARNDILDSGPLT